jgi:hypothetical protein
MVQILDVDTPENEYKANEKVDEATVFKSDLKALAESVLVNGLLLNYAACILLGLPLWPWTFPAYGLAWHYLKEEIPRIINGIIVMWKI